MACHKSTRCLSSIALIGMIALGSLSAAACDEHSTPGGPTPGNPSSITLAIGQTVTVPETSLAVTFSSVVSDSRCPSDALCVQAGEAVVEIDATTSSGAAKMALHTGDTGRTADVGNYHLELATLLPYPSGAHPPTAADYRLTLNVQSR
jgi:hypothetical protein